MHSQQNSFLGLSGQETQPFALVVLGPPASGKSERSRRISRALGLGENHIEVSNLLRDTKDPEVLDFIQTGDLVPDRYVNRLLHNEINNYGSRSVVICGSSRKESQAKSLLFYLNSQKRRTIVIDGDRPFDECQALHMLRQINQCREDDKTASIHTRFVKYSENIEGVRSFFRAHLFPQAIHRLTFTDDIEGDCNKILSMIQLYCGSFTLPTEAMVSA